MHVLELVSWMFIAGDKRSPQSQSPGCYYAWVACMQPAFVRTSTKNEWNAQSVIWSRSFGRSITCNLMTRVLTICHVKLTQSTDMKQKRFELRLLLPALRNLWLLLDNIYMHLLRMTLLVNTTYKPFLWPLTAWTELEIVLSIFTLVPVFARNRFKNVVFVIHLLLLRQQSVAVKTNKKILNFHYLPFIFYFYLFYYHVAIQVKYIHKIEIQRWGKGA